MMDWDAATKFKEIFHCATLYYIWVMILFTSNFHSSVDKLWNEIKLPSIMSIKAQIVRLTVV